MRFTPSPVAIVTTADESLRHKAGMAVSAFVPVSMEPPSMQICINRSAGAYDLLMRHGTFCVNVLGIHQNEELAIFADPSRREERFANALWQSRHGALFLEGALSSIFCRTVLTHDVGTHTIMIGEVVEALVTDLPMPAVWHAGRMLAVNAAVA
jgi:flavin reductase